MRAMVPRADRVPLPILLTYCAAGDDHWLQGRVANLSESGVLFGPTELQPGAKLQLIISSPIPVRTTPPGRIVCLARVVRTTEAGATGALFETCRFVGES